MKIMGRLLSMSRLRGGGLELKDQKDVEKEISMLGKLQRYLQGEIDSRGGAMYDEELEIWESNRDKVVALSDALRSVYRDFGKAGKRDVEWLKEHKKELAETYAGEGVIVRGGRVVDHDGNAAVLVKRTNFSGSSGLILALFPRKE